LRMRSKHVVEVLALYKRILRLHQGLPKEFQDIGTGYVRDEFKRHKGVNSEEAAVFLREWAKYASLLSNQLSPKGIARGAVGQNLTEEDIKHMRDEQVLQLFELKQEASKPKS